MDDDALLEFSRLTREAEVRTAAKSAGQQRGELFADPPAWVRFGIEESAGLVCLALFVSMLAVWAAILQPT